MKNWSWDLTLLLLLWGRLLFAFERLSRMHWRKISENCYGIACDAKGRPDVEKVRRELFLQMLRRENYSLEDLPKDVERMEDNPIKPLQKTIRPFARSLNVCSPYLLFVPMFLFASESDQTKWLVLKLFIGGLLFLISLIVMVMPYIHIYYSDLRKRDQLIAQWLTEWVEEQPEA